MAIDVIAKVRSNSYQEDSAVELKADWPDPQKSARRLAGHANAARGEPILWIIGIDQDTGTAQLTPTEMADWWAQVTSFFQGSYPEMTDIVLRLDEDVFQLLWFETTSSPYVIKNPKFGTKNAGPIEREVPWRQGTSVRTATRDDLLLILVPRTKLPDIEVLAAVASVTVKDPNQEFYVGPKRDTEPYSSWDLSIDLYVSPTDAAPCILPVHRTSMVFANDYGGWTRKAASILYYVPSVYASRSFVADSSSIERTQSEAIVHLPGKLLMRANYKGPRDEIASGSTLGLTFTVRPVGTDLAITRSLTLRETKYESDGEVTWSLSGSDGDEVST